MAEIVGEEDSDEIVEVARVGIEDVVDSEAIVAEKVDIAVVVEGEIEAKVLADLVEEPKPRRRCKRRTGVTDLDSSKSDYRANQLRSTSVSEC